jgi:thioredoxin-dependent peroxiredoxin
MIEPGSLAPDFEAPSSSGAAVRLAELKGHPVVLYFFPKANTAGCTSETRGFQGIWPELEAKGVRIVGISVDPLTEQTRFAERCGATFPIASDPSKAIAQAYGVLGLLGVAKRVTFFLGPDGKVVDRVVSAFPGGHVARARALYLTAR